MKNSYRRITLHLRKRNQLCSLFLILSFSFLIFPSVAQCTLKNDYVGTSGYLSSTGNNELDNLISSTKLKLEKFFNVSVDVKISSGANGFAKSKCNHSYCDGTIELGKDLLLYEYKKVGPSSELLIGKYMVIAIMAHEFAHIYQYTHPELRFKNSVVQEVHADMLAGWFLTREMIDNTPESKRFDWQYSSTLQKIYTDLTISFGWMGDRAYWSQQHHGNYLTRAMAFREGWKDYKERGIRDFNYFLKWSIPTAEKLINDWDQD